MRHAGQPSRSIHLMEFIVDPDGQLRIGGRQVVVAAACPVVTICRLSISVYARH